MAEKTIDKVKKAKVELESEITEMLKSFEDTHGVKMDYINIQRKRPAKQKEQIEIMFEERNKMPIETVNVEISLP